jgi:hypothetical protein
MVWQLFILTVSSWERVGEFGRSRNATPANFREFAHYDGGAGVPGRMAGIGKRRGGCGMHIASPVFNANRWCAAFAVCVGTFLTLIAWRLRARIYSPESSASADEHILALRN